MVEIIKKLLENDKFQNCDEIKKTHNIENGLGLSISKCFRILFFQNNNSFDFYIDFHLQNNCENNIFIIPAYHILYLPFNCVNYCCISYPENYLSKQEKLFFYSFKFQTKKSIDIVDNNLLLEMSEVKILKYILAKKASLNLALILKYYQKCEEIILKINQKEITYHFSPKSLEVEIFVSQATLYRICKSVFGCSPQVITRYYLLLKIIFKLLYQTNSPQFQIAYELNFKESATFTKVTKILSGLTPKEIRKQYLFITQ